MKMIPRIFFAGCLVFSALGSGVRAEAPAVAKAKSGYTVNVEVDVSEQGKPESVVLVGSEDVTTGEVLTKMAIAMAAKAELPPRLKDGQAVKYKVRMPFFFPIEDDEGADANKLPRPRLQKAGVIQPAYPLAEAQAGEVGGAILELIIGANGKVTELKTMRASKPVFGEAAAQAVKQWTFIAPEVEGRAVETRWRLAIVFESSYKMMDDLKYRIAPRPSLGTFIVGHNKDVPATPAGAAAPTAEKPAAAEAAPSITVPAK